MSPLHGQLIANLNSICHLNTGFFLPGNLTYSEDVDIFGGGLILPPASPSSALPFPQVMLLT